MADINFKQILDDAVGLAKKELGSTYKKLKPFAEHEFTQFAENAAFLAKLKLQGVIEDDELKSRLQMQKLAFSNVLLAIKGIGLVTAQNLVNGIMGIVVKAIKGAINISLPI
jgi:hypothetical protein